MNNFIIRGIARLFCTIVIQLFGGIWKVKAKLKKLQKGPIRELLSTFYYEELRKSGSWIGYNAYFYSTPIFPHGVFGIFISNGAKLGKNCVMFQHVTIGSNTLADSKRKGAPTIGDNCYIGAGAKIIGNIHIGNDCRIGANCVVYEDMPDKSVALLQPTRIIQKDHLDNKFQPFNYSE